MDQTPSRTPSQTPSAFVADSGDIFLVKVLRFSPKTLKIQLIDPKTNRVHNTIRVKRKNRRLRYPD